MSFSVRDANGVTVVKVEGQLVVGNRHELKEKVTEAVEQGAKKLVIDFTDTGYIDSSGLGVLVSLSKKLREVEGVMQLAGLNEDLKTLFELTKLDTLFTISDDVDQALASI